MQLFTLLSVLHHPPRGSRELHYRMLVSISDAVLTADARFYVSSELIHRIRQAGGFSTRSVAFRKMIRRVVLLGELVHKSAEAIPQKALVKPRLVDRPLGSSLSRADSQKEALKLLAPLNSAQFVTSSPGPSVPIFADSKRHLRPLIIDSSTHSRVGHFSAAVRPRSGSRK